MLIDVVKLSHNGIKASIHRSFALDGTVQVSIFKGPGHANKLLDKVYNIIMPQGIEAAVEVCDILYDHKASFEQEKEMFEWLNRVGNQYDKERRDKASEVESFAD